MTKQIPTVADWNDFAKSLIDSLPPKGKSATVIGLSGDLGAGKTTVVQAIGKQLGVGEPITSPTFTIFKQYQTNHTKFDRLVHMDAYRLESTSELVPLRFKDILARPNTLVCVEWAERIASALPDSTYYYDLVIDDDQQHTITKKTV